MSEKQAVSDLLDLIWSYYAAWQTALSKVPADQMSDAHVLGHWTVKDLIAHVTWSEREMLNVLCDRVFKGSDWWNLPLDERNELIYDESKDRTLADIKAEHQEVHRALVEEISRLTDDELKDGSHFADMPPDWSMAMLLPGNTHIHYKEHAEQLKNWIEESD